MALNFLVDKNPDVNARTLAKGLGVNLAKRAILKPVVKTKVQTDKTLSNLRGYADNKEEGKSLLGTPVYGTMMIKIPKYDEYVFDKKTGEYVKKPVNELLKGNKFVNGEYFMYIEGCILEVTKNRNIVTTSISGQDGTDKEFINNGDYSIKLNGFISSASPDYYPAEDMKILTACLDAPIPLEISNKFLNDYMGIDTMVVTKADFKQVKGMRNVQYFTVDFISDIPFKTIEMDNSSPPILGDTGNDFSDVA